MLPGKRNAEKLKKKLEAELMTGTYQMQTHKTWEDFRREYSDRVLAGLAPGTRIQSKVALDHFERIVKPVSLVAVV